LFFLTVPTMVIFLFRSCWLSSISSTQSQFLIVCVCVSIKFIDKALFTSANVKKCCTETHPKTPNSKQCRCGSMVCMYVFVVFVVCKLFYNFWVKNDPKTIFVAWWCTAFMEI
jgi:hypothetical protein